MFGCMIVCAALWWEGLAAFVSLPGNVQETFMQSLNQHGLHENNDRCFLQAGHHQKISAVRLLGMDFP